jgi:hypothetical protein
LRSSRDLAGNPPIGFEFVSFKTTESGIGYAPTLTVTFTFANPSIIAVAASNVSLTTAQLNSRITDDGGEIAGDTEVRFGYGTKSLLNVGTFANNTGTATPTGAILSGGFTEAAYRTTTHTVTGAGTFDITLPAGVTGTATSGTATLVGSPVALAAGATTTVDTGATTGTFTVEIATTYDTVSSWVDGYKIGDNPSLPISSLTSSTTYYFRVQVKNSTATISSANELSFLTANTISDVSVFIGLPDNNSISLNWAIPNGASQVLVRYGDSSYPTTIADGSLVYLGSSSSTTFTGMSGLASGKTYYFSVWGEDAGSYSTNPKTLVLTTLGVSSSTVTGGDDIPQPTVDTSFFQEVDETGLQKFEPFYSLINDFADSWGMPQKTMWLIAVLLLISIIGIFVLIETQRLMPALAISAVLMLGASFMSLLPAYFIGIAILVALGAWASERQ